MKKTHLAFIAVVVVAAVAYYFWTRTGGENVAVDLVEQATAAEFRPGEKKAEMFRVAPQTIAGTTKPAIFTHASSRLIFPEVTIPDNGRFRASLAVNETAWTQDASDGVLFRFGVDDNGRYEELLNQHVDPRHNANDRGWVPVDIDLSAYAGQKVKLIFNTNTSLPTPARIDNSAFDQAYWGEAAIISRP